MGQLIVVLRQKGPGSPGQPGGFEPYGENFITVDRLVPVTPAMIASAGNQPPICRDFVSLPKQGFWTWMNLSSRSFFTGRYRNPP
jgi:hypothetical protein